MSLDTIMTNMLLNTKKKSVFNTLMLLNSLLASLFLLNSLMTNLSVNTLMTNLSVNTCRWLHSNLSLNTWKRILSLITPMANHWPENNGGFFHLLTLYSFSVYIIPVSEKACIIYLWKLPLLIFVLWCWIMDSEDINCHHLLSCVTDCELYLCADWCPLSTTGSLPWFPGGVD